MSLSKNVMIMEMYLNYNLKDFPSLRNNSIKIKSASILKRMLWISLSMRSKPYQACIQNSLII